LKIKFMRGSEIAQLQTREAAEFQGFAMRLSPLCCIKAT
jgi:hypothetical protein